MNAISKENTGKRRDELKEVKAIRDLLILQLIRDGASSEEINLATGMGPANIQRKFPNVKRKGSE
jgi:hypothetical protein